jgi:hypothetical protein
MSTEQPIVPQAPSIDYSITNEGKVIRTDKDGSLHVANYKDGVLALIPDQAKFRPAVVRWINEQAAIVGSPIPSLKAVIIAGDKPDKATADIPPCPKKTMRDGDKTPAVVEWYKKYKPAEYKARYGIRGDGTVTKEQMTTDEEGKPKKILVKVAATIADRKTHLTEKPEAKDGEDYADEEQSNE